MRTLPTFASKRRATRGAGATAMFGAAMFGAAVFGTPVVSGRPAAASTIAPPMLDITRQCDAASRRNVRAMSECVVAESEARAEVLQKWDKLSDASAEKCINLGRKTKKFPYGVLAKCVALEPVDAQAASRPPTVSKPEEANADSGGSMTDWFLKKTGMRK